MKANELDIIKKDIAELSRAINLQAKLLNAIIQANDYVVKSYLEVIKVEKPNEEKKSEEPK
jgi:hypothetical protein